MTRAYADWLTLIDAARQTIGGTTAWLPIGTAPDNTPLYVGRRGIGRAPTYGPEHLCTVAWWKPHPDDPKRGQWMHDASGREEVLHWVPTHYLPLIEPPPATEASVELCRQVIDDAYGMRMREE